MSADSSSAQTRDVTFLAAKSTWRYLDTGVTPTAWNTNGFDDSGWKSGPAQLGAGDGDEATVINRTAPAHLTDLFRAAFDVADAGAVQSLSLSLVADDGAIVYLNGVNVLSDNLKANGYPVAYRGAGSGENSARNFSLPASSLRTGRNVIAVELHQDHRADPDSSFDAALTGTELVPVVGRSPDREGPPRRRIHWRYVDDGSTPNAGWTVERVRDASWKSGAAQFGAGEGDEKTVINRNAPSHLVDYFRTSFDVTNLAEIESLRLGLLADDGAVVHLNGKLVVTDNVAPNGYPVTYRDATTGENSFREFGLSVADLRTGTNVVAVALHQNHRADRDASFEPGSPPW